MIVDTTLLGGMTQFLSGEGKNKCGEVGKTVAHMQLGTHLPLETLQGSIRPLHNGELFK